MDMTGTQRIEAPRETVWAALNDPDVLKQCIPGCESTEKISDTEMNAKVTLKIGPVKASFTGKVTLSDLDPPNGYRISGEGVGVAVVNAKCRPSCLMALVQSGRKVMTKFALYVPLQAKPGKEMEVADFLRSAAPLVNDEAGTISWFAIQEGPSSFAIFDTFDDEAARDAHLNGKVAAALMEKAKAGDLFAKAPEIHKLGILADKLPK
jgi:carbon monoxide dehydrogenase subunit G/quinol monooxygenase YgiN